MKQNKLIFLGIVVIVLAALWGVFSGGEATDDGVDAGRDRRARKVKLVRNRGPKERRSAKEAVRAAMGSRKNVKPRARGEKLKLEEDLSMFCEADKKVAMKLQDALDVEDFKAVSKLATEVAMSKVPALRQRAVDALGWFGEEALPELTVFMSDKDEDVAQAAMNCWELAASEIEDAAERFTVVMSAFSTLKDPDCLEMLGSQLSGAANEVIDSDDEHADENRLTIVQMLVDLIEGDSPQNAERAREAYADITGNEWINIDEAEKFLVDPDNYEAPERDEGEAEK